MITSEDVINLYNQLIKLGIKIWIDGGWAVDALLGEQTRPHEDVDIVVQQKDVPKLRELLAAQVCVNGLVYPIQRNILNS